MNPEPRFTHCINCVLGRAYIVSLLLLFGCFQALLAGAQTKRLELLGVYPERPVVLRGTTSNAFAAFRDGSRFVCANGQAAELWDLATGRLVFSMRHPDMIIGVAIAPDEKTILTITAGRESPVRAWSLEDGSPVREYASAVRDSAAPAQRKRDDGWAFPGGHFHMPEKGFGFTSIGYSAMGDAFATGCEDGTLILWNVKTGTEIVRMTGESRRLWSVAVSPDGTRVLTSDAESMVQLWDVELNRPLKKYVERVDSSHVDYSRIPVTFSAAGERFAFPARKTRPTPNTIRIAIRLCDTMTGANVRELRETVNAGRYHGASSDGCVAFLGDGRLLANTGSVLEIWDIDRGIVTDRHTCKSGVNATYPNPNVTYVRYLPAANAAMAVEVENDENTLHEDWTTVSVVPLSQFRAVCDLESKQVP